MGVFREGGVKQTTGGTALIRPRAVHFIPDAGRCYCAAARRAAVAVPFVGRGAVVRALCRRRGFSLGEHLVVTREPHGWLGPVLLFF